MVGLTILQVHLCFVKYWVCHFSFDIFEVQFCFCFSDGESFDWIETYNNVSGFSKDVDSALKNSKNPSCRFVNIFVSLYDFLIINNNAFCNSLNLGGVLLWIQNKYNGFKQLLTFPAIPKIIQMNTFEVLGKWKFWSANASKQHIDAKLMGSPIFKLGV